MNPRPQIENTESREQPTLVVHDIASSIHSVEPPDEHPVIPGYDILKMIGRGGMSYVFLARQRKPNRLAAIKMIRPEYSLDEHMRRRFLREAYSIASLRHPNVVEIYEIGEASGMLYLCLEYVAGGSLEYIIKEGRPPPKLAAQIIRELAEALQFAHDRKIIHRDLKPGNILWVQPWDGSYSDIIDQPPNPLVKVTDFGLARLLSEASDQTQTGLPIGTPGYMSPEQASGRLDEIGVPTDIYGLGAILYELLTGRPPFRCATATETVKMVLRDTPVPLRQLVPDAPTDLERICAQCLKKDPDLRYPSAHELAEDLNRFIAGRPISGRRPNIVTRLWRRCRRRPWRSLAYVAGILFFIVGSLSLLGWRIGGERSKPANPEVEQARSGQSETPNEMEMLLQRVKQNPTLPEHAPTLAELGDEKLTAIVQKHPADFAILLAVGDAYSHLKRPDDALVHFNQARRAAEEQMRANENDTDAWRNLALALERIGDVELLKLDKLAAMRDYNKANGLRETLIGGGSTRQQAVELAALCRKQADLYLKVEDKQTARFLYQRRLDLLSEYLPNAPELTKDIRETHEWLALISRQLGNPDVAAIHEKAAAALKKEVP